MPTLIVVLALLAVVAFVVIGTYNGLVQKRVACENAWSQIDVQLKRRHDLIPNLVETVKGYATHEKDTLERVIKARNAAVQAAQSGVKEQVAAENVLSGALRQLFALTENYPDLKANENFLKLQEEVTSTENRISFARQHYNDTVAVFNTSIAQVPGNLVAGFGGFTRKEFYEVDPSEKAAIQQAPSISFS